MADKAEVDKYFEVIVERINDVGPFIAADWGGSVQFVLPDLNTGWLLKMAMDGTVESCEEKLDEDAATGVLELDSDTFVAIYSGTKSPMEFMAEGKLVGRKSMDALLKILPASAGM